MILALVVVARSLNNVTGARLNCAVQFGEIGLHCTKHEIMKHILLNFYLIGYTFYFSFAQTMYPSGVSGCVARWTFDGAISGLTDQSGNGNNGLSLNIVSDSGWNGQVQGSGLFNGLNSKSVVPHSSSLDVQDFSIVALVRVKDFYSGTCQASQIVSKGYPYFINGNYGLCIQDNYYDGDCLSYSPNNMQLSVQSANQANSPSAGNYILKDKWYFLAATFSQNFNELYQIEMDPVNKASLIQPISVVSSTMQLGSNTQDVSIGAHLNPTYPYWFNGNIDELVIFNKQLTMKELYSIYEYLWGLPLLAIDSLPEDQCALSRFENRIFVRSKSEIKKIIVFSFDGKRLIELDEVVDNFEIEGPDANQMIIVEVVFDKSRVIKKL